MAKKLYITPQHYSLIETARRQGSADIWDRLEDITGVHQRVLREDSPE